MQSTSLRRATVVISCLGVAMLLGLAILGGDFPKDTLGETLLDAWAGLLISLPSLLLAAMGGRKGNSSTLSTVLFCCALSSTTLWTLVTAYFALASAVDAQSGLLAAFAFVIHLALIFVAAISFLVLRNR